MTDEQSNTENKTGVQRWSKAYKAYSLLLEITSSARKAIRNYTKSRSIVRLSGITFPTTFLGMLTTRYNLKKTKTHDEWNKSSVISLTFSPIFLLFYFLSLCYPITIFYLILYYNLKKKMSLIVYKIINYRMETEYTKFDERIISFDHHALLVVQILRLAFTCHLQSHAHNAGKIHKTPSKNLLISQSSTFFLSFPLYVIFKWYYDE